MFMSRFQDLIDHKPLKSLDLMCDRYKALMLHVTIKNPVTHLWFQMWSVVMPLN